MSTTEIGPELILSSLEAESEELEESVEALTSFLLEAEDLADFEVSSFDELWLARQALQRIHDISLPKKVRKSKNVRDSYEVSAQASEPYDHLYDAVNQAIIRFNQTGSGEQAAQNYHEKLDGRPN